MNIPIRRLSLPLIVFLLIMSFAVLTACSSSSSDEAEMEEMESDEGEHVDGDEHDDFDGHDGGDEQDDDQHDLESADRIPNEGAVIHIIAPANGETFSSEDDIVVEVEVLGFDLNTGGNHWHLLIDGSSYTMVTGGNVSVAVQGLEAGDHDLEVYLVGKDHVEYKEGDHISIVVE